MRLHTFDHGQIEDGISFTDKRRGVPACRLGSFDHGILVPALKSTPVEIDDGVAYEGHPIRIRRGRMLTLSEPRGKQYADDRVLLRVKTRSFNFSKDLFEELFQPAGFTWGQWNAAASGMPGRPPETLCSGREVLKVNGKLLTFRDGILMLNRGDSVDVTTSTGRFRIGHVGDGVPSVVEL